MTDNESFLKTARQVITDEARALDVRADGLDENFATAVQMILQATGRIIVSGIGKSGHIGHKIAATLEMLQRPRDVILRPVQRCTGCCLDRAPPTTRRRP